MPGFPPPFDEISPRRGGHSRSVRFHASRQGTVADPGERHGVRRELRDSEENATGGRGSLVAAPIFADRPTACGRKATANSRNSRSRAGIGLGSAAKQTGIALRSAGMLLENP